MRRWIARLPILHKILLTNSVILLIGAVAGIAVTERVTEEGRFTPAAFVLIVLGSIFLGASLNYIILKVAFKPLEQLQAVVKQVHAGNLRARAALERASDPDIGHFGNALNAMLERMEANERIIREDKKKLQAQAAQIITAQEEERKRVARELHDESSQALTTLIIGLESLLESMPSDPDHPKQQVLALRTLAEDTLDEVRNLALSLRPTVLDDLGLASAVRWYARSICGKAGLELALDMVNLEDRLPPAVETAVFRIVQEGLANIARHAQARHVLIRLQRSEGQIHAVIRDDGQGFDTARVLSSQDRGGGLGIFGIEERVNILGGKWNLNSEAGAGTTLTVSIPLVEEAA